MSLTRRTVKTPIGARYSLFAQVVSRSVGQHPVYGDIIDMGENVKAYFTKTYATGDIYGDDKNLLHDELFVSGQLDCETTCSDLELNAAIYGRSFVGGVEASNVDDVAPEGGYGYIEPILLANKTRVYRATFLYLVTAMPSQEKDEADTRKNDFNPKMNAVSFSVAADNTGDFRARQEFNSEAAALAWIQSKFGSNAAYGVTVRVSGNGTVTPSGTTFVTAGQNLELTLSSAPVAFYDNGVDASASISNSKYTISSIAAAHDIIAVFAAS